jgi:uncharacterized protein
MFIYIIIGIITGFTIGLMGIGAGVIMIPLLISTGLSIKNAVAIGLFLQVIPQTLPAIYMHYKNKTLPLKIAIIVTISSIFGIILGTKFLINEIIPLFYIYLLLSILLLIVSIYIFYNYVYLEIK